MRQTIGNLIGITAGVLGASMVLPQVVRAKKKGTQGISSATFQIFAVSNAGWFAYAISQHLTVSLFTNAFLALCNIAILILLAKDGTPFRKLTNVAIIVAPISIVIALINTGWLAWWGGILSLLLRAPQAQRLRRSSDISGVSLTIWILGAVANVFWAVYGFLLNDLRLAIVCTGVALMSASLSLAVVSKRRALASNMVK